MDPVTKANFVALHHTHHANWMHALAQVPEEAMHEPAVAGDAHWSVKDVIAHITWYQREMVGVLHAHALVGSELWSVSQDERNAAIYAQNRDRTIADIRAEADQVYAELLAALDGLTEEDLTDPARFPGMEPDWVPWELIASNTYEHEQEHTEQLQRWLKVKKRDHTLLY